MPAKIGIAELDIVSISKFHFDFVFHGLPQIARNTEAQSTETEPILRSHRGIARLEGVCAGRIAGKRPIVHLDATADFHGRSTMTGERGVLEFALECGLAFGKFRVILAEFLVFMFEISKAFFETEVCEGLVVRSCVFINKRVVVRKSEKIDLG